MRDPISETLFPQYCNKLNITVERVDEGDERRPDYRLHKDGMNCIAEVKEFTANKEETHAIASYNSFGCSTAYGCKPGHRVRKKISDAIPQLKSLTNNMHPGLLVLYYNVPELPADGCADPYHILTAMYGLQTITLTDNHFGNNLDKFGPCRKVSANDNTTLSAILVIRKLSKVITSSLYHNNFAATPLPFEFFNHDTCTQFKIDCKDNKWTNWVRVHMDRLGTDTH